MATLEDFRAWYERDLSRFASWEHSVQIDENYGVGATPYFPVNGRKMRVRLFTDRNVFSISVHEPEMILVPLRDTGSAQIMPGEPCMTRMNDGYLGCIATSRKWRAGEDWHRGRDLRDGPFTEERWHAIIADILSYELERFHKRKATLADGVNDAATP